jgi:molecular chaperone GrpE (heat shock protein)
METKPTDDANLDGLVSSTLRPGYLFDGKLIRPQEVIVYKLSVE